MATPRTYAYHRPIGVTVIVVLLWIQGIIAIAGGIVLLIERNNATVLDQIDYTSNELRWAAIGSIVFGAITVLVAWGLGGGSRFMRFLVALVSILHVVGGVYVATDWEGSARTSGIVQAAIGLAILYILYGTRSSQEFFARN